MRARSETPRRGYSTVHVSLDQLEGVPVAGDDQHLHAELHGLGGQRGDQVVGLEARHRDRRDPQRVEHLVDQADLAAEVVGGARSGPPCTRRRPRAGTSARTRSKHTAMWLGCSSRSRLISIEVKPKTALVGWPVVVVKFSTGSAKNAR